MLSNFSVLLTIESVLSKHYNSARRESLDVENTHLRDTQKVSDNQTATRPLDLIKFGWISGLVQISRKIVELKLIGST